MKKSSEKNKKIFTVLGDIQIVQGVKRFVPKSKEYLKSLIDYLPMGKTLACTFYERPTTRSESQLDYHWVLLTYLAKHTGYTKEELHDAIMKIQFGTQKKKVVLGDMAVDVEIRKSVSNKARMSKGDMVELINFDLQVCSDLGVHVPTPESLGYISNYGLVKSHSFV